MACAKTLAEHLNANHGPKRILALDGGGLRGILSIGFLQKVEDLLRERHGGDPGFRLCDYFDLIAGTSTGAIIAAALAKGWSVEEIRLKYVSLGERVFEKGLFRLGLIRAKYDAQKLIDELKSVYGEDTTLGSHALRTGLMVVMKRLDTGSPWPVSNNPAGTYYNDGPGHAIGNSRYPLWQVVRASTAAPVYFERETITIAEALGMKLEQGDFVDGGVSPFNNPALQALMYATLEGYKLKWPMGADKLLLVFVGTGSADPSVKRASLAAQEGLAALAALMDDAATLQEVMLQWMSSSATARRIDGEIGDLGGDLLGGQPLISYARYNVSLGRQEVAALAPTLAQHPNLDDLSEMDAPENMPILEHLGKLAADRLVADGHFPAAFDLAMAP